MVQITKKRYYLLILLLLISVFYGFKKHGEVSNQQDYLNPHLMEMMHSFQNEMHLASSILHTAMTENQIPYAQWKQLNRALKVIEDVSYEMEKMGRAIYPRRAQGLENATKNTSYLIANYLEYIEENFLADNLDRLDSITFPTKVQSMLELIYETTVAWNEVSSRYTVSNDIIKRTYWVEMMKDIQDPSIVFQHQYLNW
ncbi:hypothetical protein BKP35_16145 [Anaerobacillus arseniciselenatis]|uniref:Uncharacterized protein n=1 Tax=Anaerobacillus arseniciselenatis TaxID=85682 RepID=A0A1S2LBG1_9BACI|nr:hypothetical protein [Anaerobacillus arseniciselenatis]OIJ09686.1 hypothetical protein BKP35_16145 [Anaerobacillus arseniciselenatis]